MRRDRASYFSGNREKRLGKDMLQLLFYQGRPAADWLWSSRQSILWNIAHKQCHTRFNSCPMGSHDNSFFANSAALLIKSQIFTSSSLYVASLITTARRMIRAVIMCRIEPRWLKALSFLQSIGVDFIDRDCLPQTQAVTDHGIEPGWLLAITFFHSPFATEMLLPRHAMVLINDFSCLAPAVVI